MGIYDIQDAIDIADELELDLVEISPKVNPPVCKVMDYKKYLFDQKKKKKEQKDKNTKVVTKEIRLGPNIDDHDFNFKLKHAINFLKSGFKVKADILFKGRTITYSEQGEIILLKFAQALEDYGTVERFPKLEGRKMIMIISPKK